MSTAAYKHAWYVAHKEQVAAYAAAYRAGHREQVAARGRTYYAAHREAKAAAGRRRLYGDEADFQAVVAQQNGMCLGCGEQPTCIDHNHDTGAIRGALCNRCNLEDVLGRNSLTDPDLSKVEMDQLHDLVSAALEAGSPTLATSRAYEARRKTRGAAIKAARLAEIDRQWEALHPLDNSVSLATAQSRSRQRPPQKPATWDNRSV